jgi:hypothetical protein
MSPPANPPPVIHAPDEATTPIGNILSQGKGETSVGGSAKSGGDTAHDIEAPSAPPKITSQPERLDMSKVPMMRARVRGVRLP